jgi:hypothetical protein
MVKNSPSLRILQAWVELETALREALPACSVAPPTQPSELLSALRINHSIGPEEERCIHGLREIRNRVAHDPEEPREREAEWFGGEVQALLEKLQRPFAALPPGSC